MKAEKKENYWIRIKRVKADLLKLGISSDLLRSLFIVIPLVSWKGLSKPLRNASLESRLHTF